MGAEDESYSSRTRPDLDEFLSALGGFLETQTSPKDPSYLRFLSMFCRSVGAGEGHFLKRGPRAGLSSVISFGIGAEFDEEFNRAHANADDPCPLDEACDRKEVVAIVELQKDPSIPPWFMEMMNKYNLRSMVAVPLIGHSDVNGILCAYYRDVCLFDQNTLDHLMMIGRMIGAATEKSIVAERASSLSAYDKVADDFLALLVEKNLTTEQMFQLVSKIVAKTIAFDGFVIGPARKTGESVTMMWAAGDTVPSPMLSHRYELPVFLAKPIGKGEEKETMLLPQKEWGSFSPALKRESAKALCMPIVYQRKLVGAFVGWRYEDDSFEPSEMTCLVRLLRLLALSGARE